MSQGHPEADRLHAAILEYLDSETKMRGGNLEEAAQHTANVLADLEFMLRNNYTIKTVRPK